VFVRLSAPSNPGSLVQPNLNQVFSERHQPYWWPSIVDHLALSSFDLSFGLYRIWVSVRALLFLFPAPKVAPSSRGLNHQLLTCNP
jgi:hypothetical protein